MASALEHFVVLPPDNTSVEILSAIRRHIVFYLVELDVVEGYYITFFAEFNILLFVEDVFLCSHGYLIDRPHAHHIPYPTHTTLASHREPFASLMWVRLFHRYYVSVVACGVRM